MVIRFTRRKLNSNDELSFEVLQKINTAYSTSFRKGRVFERERSYCAPSCTTASASLGLLSICCQPSSIIRNFGGVPPLDKLQLFQNTTQ